MIPSRVAMLRSSMVAVNSSSPWSWNEMVVANVTCVQRLYDLHLYILIAAHRIKGRAVQNYPSLLDNTSPLTIAFHPASYVSMATAR